MSETPESEWFQSHLIRSNLVCVHELSIKGNFYFVFALIRLYHLLTNNSCVFMSYYKLISRSWGKFVWHTNKKMLVTFCNHQQGWWLTVLTEWVKDSKEKSVRRICCKNKLFTIWAICVNYWVASSLNSRLFVLKKQHQFASHPAQVRSRRRLWRLDIQTNKQTSRYFVA